MTTADQRRLLEDRQARVDSARAARGHATDLANWCDHNAQPTLALDARALRTRVDVILDGHERELARVQRYVERENQPELEGTG